MTSTSDSRTNYDDLYRIYTKCDETVARFRVKGGIYRHVYSLPFRWTKASCQQLILRRAEKQNKFRNLKDTGHPGLIISLTSFPARIATLHRVIKSLLNQTYCPEKIVIWLSEDEFPLAMESMPKQLTDFIAHGVEIQFVTGNLRSHKKYFYAFQRYPEETVITVDDDLVYPTDTIERLISMHQAYPQSVCANVTRTLSRDANGFRPYTKWRKNVNMPFSASKQLVAVGYGGVLYPPKWYDKTLFDEDLIRSKCLFADDLWLKAHQLLKNVSVASGKCYFPQPTVIPHSQKVSLQKKNNGRLNMNDIQWENLRSALDLDSIYNAL